uniref:NADPH:quinone reductase (Qor) n=1 Tax=uncultured marine group II/III euryarchaeote KM3_133_A04 TaxID=1457863 RepID=A0A075G8X3_9EURY|nr:NADPH:quinone reductase (qor) [uncultured marine group II/III euryarchaeote KM3_133_A04]
MRALHFEAHGELDVLQFGDVPDPEVPDGWALLKVEACALNHLDIWVRRGWPGLKLEMPHIGGSDVAGTLGADAGDWQAGDAVVVDPGISTRHDEWTERGDDSMSPGYRILGEHLRGGCAEFVAVPLANLHSRPAGLTAAQAAAPLLAGLTAWRMLVHRARLQPGERLLVVGAGGGVNSTAIQLGRHLGAEVHVVAGGDAKAQRAAELGAALVVDYKADAAWHKPLLAATERRGYDVIVDNIGRATWKQSLRLAGIGGRIVTVGNTSGPLVETDIRFIFSRQLSILGSTMGSHTDFAAVLELLAQGALKPLIHCELPLSEGVRGHEILERGEMFGKVVLLPD